MLKTIKARECFRGRFAGKKILVTGHTGFKGSWLCLWLRQLGADVIGFSLPAPTSPSHFGVAAIEMESVLGDVRDRERLHSLFALHQPEIVFHLAAQPLVRLSYDQPIETYSSNVMGTVNLLEAARQTGSAKAILCVTSDKVYENVEAESGYCESDRLGGFDPYSCSKACCELIVNSFRQSFFPIREFGTSHRTLIATARAGNVIGGGDWAKDRLVPDAVRAASLGQKLLIRSPHSVRPWQHVLEPLAGYLLLTEKLLAGETQFAKAWNFGPSDDGNVPVADLILEMRKHWDAVDFETPNVIPGPHETKILKLNSALAQQQLTWKPVWNWRAGVEQTALWYRRFYEHQIANSEEDLQRFVFDANQKELAWAA